MATPPWPRPHHWWFAQLYKSARHGSYLRGWRAPMEQRLSTQVAHGVWSSTGPAEADTTFSTGTRGRVPGYSWRCRLGRKWLRRCSAWGVDGPGERSTRQLYLTRHPWCGRLRRWLRHSKISSRAALSSAQRQAETRRRERWAADEWQRESIMSPWEEGSALEGVI